MIESNAALQQSRARIIHGHRGIRRRACRAGRRWAFIVHPDVLVLRNGPCRAQSVACFGRRDTAVLQKSAQSALLHHVGKIGRGGVRAVRALDAPLRAAGVAHRLDAGRRRAGAGACLDGVGAPVLPAHAFRARVRASAAPAATASAHCRADVRAFRHAAARHGRGLPAQSRRLHHRVGRCAHGAVGRRQVRSRRLHRLRHFHAACARRRNPRPRGLPAGGAGDCRRRGDGSGQRSLRADFDDVDGRPDRHQGQPDRRQYARRTARHQLVPAQRDHQGAVSQCRDDAQRLSGLPAAQRLRDDESRPPHRGAQAAVSDIW